MEEVNQAAVTWRKSTRSNGSGDCVEVADNLSDMVALRDSKDPSGPVLTFTLKTWTAFLHAAKQGRVSPQ
ncbi:DUF397 domain-containing protein [Micromonospora sp. NPDC093244]|uniref:DUF397 domain-containing protein n=1 Tax=Micromonospora sp. NPDC093244 TaxID=3155071 RepID=UPI00343FDD60